MSAAEVSARQPPLPHQLQLVEDGVRGVRAVRRERPVVPTGPTSGVFEQPEAERSSVQVRVILPVDGAVRGDRDGSLKWIRPPPPPPPPPSELADRRPRATRPALRKNRRRYRVWRRTRRLGTPAEEASLYRAAPRTWSAPRRRVSSPTSSANGRLRVAASRTWEGARTDPRGFSSSMTRTRWESTRISSSTP